MGPIEMPFGTFDLLGDLTKFPKLHCPSPIGRGPTMGRNTQVDCRFLCFSSCHCHCYLFFFSNSSTGGRTLVIANFSRPKTPLVHVFFVVFAIRSHNLGAMAQKVVKLPPEIGKSHCKQQTQITRKRREMQKKHY